MRCDGPAAARRGGTLQRVAPVWGLRRRDTDVVGRATSQPTHSHFHSPLARSLTLRRLSTFSTRSLLVTRVDLLRLAGQPSHRLSLLTRTRHFASARVPTNFFFAVLNFFGIGNFIYGSSSRRAAGQVLSKFFTFVRLKFGGKKRKKKKEKKGKSHETPALTDADNATTRNRNRNVFDAATRRTSNFIRE